ncbi:MAG: AAA domain-containing protein, partial [Bacteroidota bacterium]
MENNRYQIILDAIEAERAEEEKYYLSINQKQARQDKIKAGVLLYPLSLERSNYTIGERIELNLFRTKNKEQNHKFKVGVACTLSIEGRADRTYKASIAFARKNEFRIILSNSELNLGEFPKSAWYFLELTYDEKPYKVMRQAVHNLLNTKSQVHKELRDGIANLDAFNYQAESNRIYHPKNLNKSQEKAVNELIKSAPISIIHGPPGTGKTTTIVELVNGLLKFEKRVLVCAPSNNAVDLLAKRLENSNLKVLRIGNVARIDDNITHLTLEQKSRSHSEWSHIKKVKIEAEEARKSASNYKRSFGDSERAHRQMMYKEYRELKKWARDLEDRLLEKIVEEADVICGTLIGIENKNLEGLKFDTVIIDEASQALEPECWNAILKANKVVLVGDHLQLPPTVKSKKAIALGLEETLLHRLTEHIHHAYLLEEQYRMHEKILSFSNEQFYKGKLMSAEKVKQWTLPNYPNPLVLIDTSGCGFDEDFNYKSKSISNEGEYFILREYLISQSEKIVGASIGII